ncbi:MAG: LysM peptidoglycan-binding domain-containing protein [Chloroflexota bacterium]
MQRYRLMIVLLLLMSLLFVGTALAQDEATEEPEATEVVDEAEMTEEPVDDAPEATETPDDDTPVEGSDYVVQAGDNLFRIALRFGVTTEELAQANNIANPALIFVGQSLVIPGTDDVETPDPEPTDEPEVTQTPEATEAPDDGGDDDTDTPAAAGTYVVQAGDNLFRIAVSNGTTLATLLELNPSIANPNLIFVGQRIALPNATDETSEDSATEDTETDTEADATEEATTEDSADALDVEMMTGIEVFIGDDVANASLATQLGVDWVKMTVNWADVEPVEGEFDFEALDVAIDAFDANFDIMLTLTGAPDWARPSSTELALEQPTYGPPDDLATFGTFAEAVAERYVGRVDAYEIWYQPNNRLTWMRTDVQLRSDGFADAGLSDTRYIDLLEVAYNGIKSADSDALVITAGLAPTGNNDFYNSIDNFVFFEALLEQGASNFSDGFGVHIDGFSNAPDAECCGTAESDPEFDESYHFFFGETLNNFREILDRNGGSDLPLWVTRFGWGTTDGASGDGSELPFVSLNTAQDQADYTISALDAGDERGDVGAMILYNLNGCTSGDTTSCYYSLIDSDGGAREVFNAVASR